MPGRCHGTGHRLALFIMNQGATLRIALGLLLFSLCAFAQTVGLGTGNYSQATSWITWAVGLTEILVGAACVLCIWFASFELKHGFSHGLPKVVAAIAIAFFCGIATFIVFNAFPNQGLAQVFGSSGRP